MARISVIGEREGGTSARARDIYISFSLKGLEYSSDSFSVQPTHILSVPRGGLNNTAGGAVGAVTGNDVA